MKIQIFAPLLTACGAVVFLAAPTHAAVTTIAWYRLGENDPGAASGLAVTNLTTDAAGANHLQQFNSPHYTDEVFSGSPDGLNSTLAVSFDGTDQVLSNAVVSTAINNFGLEAWVKPNLTTNFFGNAIVYNGSVFSGWGLFGNTPSYTVIFGGKTNFTLGPATNGVWAHLAVVRDNGDTKLYFNGVAVGTNTAAPIFPTGGFEIGHRAGAIIDGFFDGTIDEVRVFTFAPGQFDAADLLINIRRVITLPASNVAQNSATLNGIANPVGFDTSAWFEYGPSTNYGSATAPQAIGSGVDNVNLSQVLTDLFGGVPFHYRAVASNSVGIAFGSDQSFGPLPEFYDIGAGLPGVDSTDVGFFYSSGFTAWGDYDNDGRLDILLAGQGLVEIWRNTGAGFTNSGATAGLPPLSGCSVAWGDLDNDGRLDFLVTGRNGGVTSISVVRRNTGSGFIDMNTNINAHLGAVHAGAAVLGDYDNDGLLDILMTGSTEGLFGSSIPFTEVYRNVGNGWSSINAGLTAADNSSAAWGDYDNDGRLDVMLNPYGIWRNTGGGFTNAGAGVAGFSHGSVAWGDYDNDGRLDLLQTGSPGANSSGAVSRVWRNTGNGFTNINAGLPGVFRGAAAWGDYDNDGRLDILLTGTTNDGALGGLAQVWRNTGNGFTNINVGLPRVSRSSVAWGDYDNDGRLDILIAGVDTNVVRITQVWRNNTPITNTPPSAPSGLNVTLFGQTATFTWDSASDAQTPASGLSYNLRVGTAPGGSDLVGPMAAASGQRRLPQLGNMQMVKFRSMTVPAGQPIYWSVQAVDTAFTGSPFAAEQSFAFNSVFTPTNGIPVPGDINGDGIVTQSELDLVLSNYFSNSPFLYMTNVAGLGGTNVTFSLTNDLTGAFSVQYSTNLIDWYDLGPATPRYLFTDTNAPAEPQRYYRLRWP